MILLLACMHALPPGPSPAEQAAAPPEPLVVEIPGDTVYLEAAWRAGSAWDPVGQEGLAALTAHLLREGGTATRSPEEVEHLLYTLGAELEVVVGKELVVFRGRALAEDAPALLDLVAEMATRPGFDAATADRLRDEARQELTTELTTHDEALGDTTLDSWLYEGHRYGHPVDGREGSLALLDADDARAFHQRVWTREATTIGLGGAVDADLAASVRDAFSALPSTRARPPTPAPVRVPRDRSLLLVQNDTDSVGVHFGHPLDLTPGSREHAALTVGMASFGLHRESIGTLYRELRGERGLNYGDYAYAEFFDQDGWSTDREIGSRRLHTQAYVWLRPLDAAAAPFALRAAVALFEDLAEHGLSEGEFDAITAYLAGRRPLEAASPARRLAMLVEREALGLDATDWLPELTLDDVNAALAEHLDPGALQMVVVARDTEAFAAAVLEETVPVPVYATVPTPEVAATDAVWASHDLSLAEDRITHVSAEGLFR